MRKCEIKRGRRCSRCECEQKKSAEVSASLSEVAVKRGHVSVDGWMRGREIVKCGFCFASKRKVKDKDNTAFVSLLGLEFEF